MDTLENQPQAPASALFPEQVDLLLAAGQYILRQMLPEYEFRSPLEIQRLVGCRPQVVAHYARISVAALFTAFPGRGFTVTDAPPPPPRPASTLFDFLRPAPTPGPVELPPPLGPAPDKLCLSVIRGLLEAHGPLFGRLGIPPDGVREAQLFAALVAAAVLEGMPDTEVPIRNLMRLWGVPVPEWPQVALQVVKSTQRANAPFWSMALEEGQTELDTTFVLNPAYLPRLGFTPPPPRKPKKASKATQEARAPAPPTPKKAEEEERSVCTFEPPQGLPSLPSLVVSSEVFEELRFVLALCARTHPRDNPQEPAVVRSTPPGPAPRLLFHGPPGTGKTHAARALAHDLGRPLALVPPGTLLQKWVGDTEKAIERAFKEAAEHESLLFLDEADSFLYDRRSASQSFQVTAVNALLNQLDRVLVPVVLCTNMLGSLDAAVHRRIDHMIEFPIPELDQRRTIWAKEIARAKLWRAAPDYDRLAQLPLSGGLIHNAVTQAARRHLVQGKAFTVDTDSLLALAMKELPKMGDLGRTGRRIGFEAQQEDQVEVLIEP